MSLIDRLIVLCLTPFSTVFQLYQGGQCTYPCFLGVLLTSTPHNIHSKPSAGFLLNHCRNNRQWQSNESCCNDYHKSSERTLAEPATSCSQVRNTNYWLWGTALLTWYLTFTYTDDLGSKESTKLWPMLESFWRMWPRYLTLTLADDHDLDTYEKVLPQGIHTWNMKALSLTIKKLGPRLKILADKQCMLPAAQ